MNKESNARSSMDIIYKTEICELPFGHTNRERSTSSIVVVADLAT